MEHLSRQILAALLCFAVDSDSLRAPVRDHCDRIELNHYVNSAGETVLDQIIFWDFRAGEPRSIVRAWRSHKCFAQTPYRVNTGLYRACWHDSRDSNAMRIVTAGSFCETYTDFDAETTNQEVCDRERRRELTLPETARKRGRR